jgi:HSP20 family protein
MCLRPWITLSAAMARASQTPYQPPVRHSGRTIKKGAVMATSVQPRRDIQQPRPVRRFEPFQEFEELQNQMGQLIESVLAPPRGANGGSSWSPLVDIEETEDAWVVEAELPGVDRNDVTVELRDSELEISGEIKERERKGIIRRQTRRTGRYEYRVKLPGQANPEQIEAKLHDGVLTVRVAKTERTRPRRIEVKA